MLDKDWLRFLGKPHPRYCTCHVCQERRLEKQEKRPGARPRRILRSRRALNPKAAEDLAEALEAAPALLSKRARVVRELLHRGLVYVVLVGVALLVGLAMNHPW